MTDHDRPRHTTTSRRTVLLALTTIPLGVGLASLPGTATPTTPELRAGMSGPAVRELQIRIAGWASDQPAQTYLTINGTFDPATEAAVRRFQQAYGLPPDGIVGAPTRDRLTALESPDRSTTHFEWEQFTSPDGSGFTGGAEDPVTTQENVRRLMYKLEALHHKTDGREIAIINGFHSTAHHNKQRGPATGIHRYGGTADITIPGLTTYTVYHIAQTCGFSGLGSYTQSWLHCDNGLENLPNGNTDLVTGTWNPPIDS
jgi:zinc D-Ala-D-Ala carboxypeptidase